MENLTGHEPFVDASREGLLGGGGGGQGQRQVLRCMGPVGRDKGRCSGTRRKEQERWTPH